MRPAKRSCWVLGIPIDVVDREWVFTETPFEIEDLISLYNEQLDSPEPDFQNIMLAEDIITAYSTTETAIRKMIEVVRK